MHLICLGLVKRFLAHNKYGWVFGKPPYKLGAFYVNKISNRLLRLQRHIPAEFARKTRQIIECKRYKATEFRTFLLYTGPVVLKTLFQQNNIIILCVFL